MPEQEEQKIRFLPNLQEIHREGPGAFWLACEPGDRLVYLQPDVGAVLWDVAGILQEAGEAITVLLRDVNQGRHAGEALQAKLGRN